LKNNKTKITLFYEGDTELLTKVTAALALKGFYIHSKDGWDSPDKGTKIICRYHHKDKTKADSIIEQITIAVDSERELDLDRDSTWTVQDEMTVWLSISRGG